MAAPAGGGRSSADTRLVACLQLTTPIASPNANQACGWTRGGGSDGLGTGQAGLGSDVEGGRRRTARPPPSNRSPYGERTNPFLVSNAAPPSSRTPSDPGRQSGTAPPARPRRGS